MAGDLVRRGAQQRLNLLALNAMMSILSGCLFLPYEEPELRQLRSQTQLLQGRVLRLEQARGSTAATTIPVTRGASGIFGGGSGGLPGGGGASPGATPVSEPVPLGTPTSASPSESEAAQSSRRVWLPQIEWGNAFTKLARGASNTVTGWVEIPKRVDETSKASGAGAGLTFGFLRGLGYGFVRTVAGVYEVVTFPFPAPPGYRSVICPEYVFTCECQEGAGNESPGLGLPEHLDE